MTKVNSGFEYKNIIVEKTAQVYVLGDSNCKKNAWLCAHGYAMTADQLLKKFTELNRESNYILAPEGLSKFYWEGLHSDKVVASWMTKRHRLFEIKDYCNYLDSCFSEFNDFSKKILFGFSQGGTTMWRYINEKKPDFDVFINWAGNVPQDSNYDLEYLKNKKLVYINGSQDPLMTPERFENLKAFCLDIDIPIQFETFDGTHRVDRDFLISIVSKYIHNGI